MTKPRLEAVIKQLKKMNREFKETKEGLPWEVDGNNYYLKTKHLEVLLAKYPGIWSSLFIMGGTQRICRLTVTDLTNNNTFTYEGRKDKKQLKKFYEEIKQLLDTRTTKKIKQGF